MTDDRIKSCPFCGSLDLNFVEGSTFRWIVAECQSCGARCGETRVKTLGDQDPDGDKAAALAEWNRRAIEAECRVPDGWQLVPMEPTAEQMEAVINRYCHYNDVVRDEYRTYNIERLRHDYIAAVAAAPKPEKAEPDCECGAVASEHCPACEPVAQEPTAFLIEGFDGNGKRVAAVIQQNADNARNSASVFAEHYPSVKTSGLYLAPPDQSAEVERLKADWLKLYEEFAKANNANYARIAELERQQAVLVEALEEARDEVVGWAAYASEYFQQKHNLKGYVEKLDATLASVKGNAEVNGGRLADRPSEAV